QRLPEAGSEQASTRSEAADAAAPSPVPAAAQPQASPSTRQRAERMPATSPIVLLADPLHGSATHALVGPEFAALQQLRTLGPLLAFDGRDSALADPAPHCPGQWAHPSAEPLARESLRRSL